MGINETNPGSKLQVVSTSNTVYQFSSYTSQNIGNGVGAILPMLKIDGRTANNDVFLKLFARRHTATTDTWPGVAHRIQHTVDATDMGYVEFNPGNGTQGLAFGNGTSEYMRIANGGNVGIGTASPSGTLDVRGTSVYVGNQVNSPAASGATSNANIVLSGAGNNPITGSLPSIYHRGYVGLGLCSDYSISFEVNANTSRVDAMRITDTGRVGIGTTSPGNLLSVNNGTTDGTVCRLVGGNGATASAGPSIDFSISNLPTYSGASIKSLNSYTDGSGQSAHLAFYTANWNGSSGSLQERMRITSGGNVGIGITNPGSALSFGNPVVNKIITLYDGNASDPVSTATNFYGFGINGSTLRYQVPDINTQHLFYCGATAYFRINSSGGANVSDRRFKAEVEPISNALATVQQLQGITFKMQDLEKRQMGFIAQDVADIVPEVVSYDEGCDSHFLSYDKLTALLCEAIKDLSAENTALKTQMASVEQRLAAAGL